jgi:hypothetical protein
LLRLFKLWSQAWIRDFRGDLDAGEGLATEAPGVAAPDGVVLRLF